MQAHQSKHSIGGSTSREREREMYVLFLNFVSFLLFFYSEFQSLCRSLQNLKNLIVRFQFLNTILTGILSRQSERKRFGFLKEKRNSAVIWRVNIGDPAYRIV